MDAFTQLCVATVLFVGGHFLLSSTSLRGVLVRTLGEQPFRGLFSLLALASIVWMSMAYGDAAPGRTLYWLGAGGQYATIALMLPATLLVVGGLSTRNPTMAGAEGGFDREDAVRGILRVSRNPFLWGAGLWAVGHLLANGDTASLVLFGGLAVLAILGSFAVDAKYRRREPQTFGAFAAATSNIPLAAVLSGRQSVARAAAEFGWWRLALALAIYGAILHLHAWMFGVSPLPA